MSKIYYIYEIWGKKIGCAIDLERRIKAQAAFKGGRYEVLEVHTDVMLVSQREIELQKQYGYRVDTIPYYKTLKNQKKAATPEVRKKAVANTDWKAKVANTDYKAISAKRTANTDYKARTSKIDYKAIVAKKDYKAFQAQRIANTDYKVASAKRSVKISKPIIQYDKQGNFIKKWKSATEAKNELGYKDTPICNCLKGRCKTAGGYVWKYAN